MTIGNHVFPQREKNIKECANSFLGEIDQIPPMFSAIKVNGERLYKKARKGEMVEVKPRKVTIDTFEITAIDFPNVHFEIQCTKGTYIRSLVRDFGKKLEVGAYMSALRRTQIGEYHINDATPLSTVVEQAKAFDLYQKEQDQK